MQLNTLLCLTLLGSATAQTLSTESRFARRLHPREVLTLVTIKSSLKHGAEGVNAVNRAFQGVTADNAKSSLGSANTALLKLSSDVQSDMKKMKASGAIGIGEILGILQENARNELFGVIGGLFTALNATAFTIGAKRDIIKASGAVDVIVPGIKSQKQGLLDIMAIVPSQVPSIAKGPINGIISNLIGGAKSAAPATPPALLRRQTGKGKGKGKGTSTPKASSSASSSGGSGVTIDTIFSSPESLEAAGKVLDGALDRLVSWLRGTTEDLIPAELLAGLAKGFPKGPKTPKAAAPPKAD